MLFINKTRKIGIHIAPKYIAVSEKIHKADGSAYFNERRFELTVEGCSVSALVEDYAVIVSVANYVAERVGNEYADIYIALSEPYLETKILSIDRHPKKDKHFKEYLKWKLKNEYYIDSDNMHLTYETLGGGQGAYSVLVQACDKKLVQVINDSFSNRSIPVKVIDASYNYIHNYLISVVKSEHTYFLLHLDGYWVFSSINDDMWPDRIRSECVLSPAVTEQKWVESLDELYSNIARTFYLDIKAGDRRGQGDPVVHSVGNINVDYQHGWDNYFPIGRKPARDYMSNTDYKYYFGTDGYMAIERLVALCQR